MNTSQTVEEMIYNTIIQAADLINENQPGFSQGKELFSEAFQLHQAGQFDKAVLRYEEAGKVCPALFEAKYNIGLCYEKLNRAQKAIDTFAKAATLHPLYKPTFWHLARLYEKSGNHAASDYNWNIYNQL